MDSIQARARLKESLAIRSKCELSEPSGIPYPATLEDVKRQLKQAIEAKKQREEQIRQQQEGRPPNQQREEEKGQKSKKICTEQHRHPSASTSNSTIPHRSSSPPLPSAASLLPTRLSRLDRQRNYDALEEKLSFITWVEFRRQAQAIQFMAMQQEGKRRERIERELEHKQAEEEMKDSDTTGNQLTKKASSSSSTSTSTSGDLRLFSYELGLRSARGQPTGARRFILTTYDDMWVRYFTFHASQRHHYEMIMENHPCHLYFDIEFKWLKNRHFRRPEACGGDDRIEEGGDSPTHSLIEIEPVMKALCNEIVTQLNSRFHFHPPVTCKQLLQLDSSSSVKFSRHIIVRLDQDIRQTAAPQTASLQDDDTHSSTSSTPCVAPSAKRSRANHPPPSLSTPPAPRFMFRNNFHAGRFVRTMCNDIARQVRQPIESHQQSATPVDDSQMSDHERQRLEHLRLLRYCLVQDSHAHQDDESAPSSSSSTSPPFDSSLPPHFQPMIDQGVYTRNRSFRLFLSSKNIPPHVGSSQASFSSSASSFDVDDTPPVLLVADSNEFPLDGVALKDIFMATLICNIQCSTSELRLLTFSETDEAAILPAGSVSSDDFSPNHSDDSARAIVSPSIGINANGKRIRAAATSSSSSTYSSSSRRFHPAPSPFPRLESFLINKILRKDSFDSYNQPRISGWTYFKDVEGGTNATSHIYSPHSSQPSRHRITFNLSHYRYCANIGRSHRSNGVYFMIDLLTNQLEQRCWDIDCRYFRSRPVSIPSWMIELELDEMNKGEEDEDEEEEIFRKAMEEQANRPARSTSSSTSNPSSSPSSSSSSSLSLSSPKSLLDDDDFDIDIDMFDAIQAQAQAHNKAKEKL